MAVGGLFTVSLVSDFGLFAFGPTRREVRGDAAAAATRAERIARAESMRISDAARTAAIALAPRSLVKEDAEDVAREMLAHGYVEDSL
jgi:hypothetical protein